MKKVLFFLTAVVAVVLVSCTKEQDVKPQAPQGPAQTISFTVSHEADPATATAIDLSTGNVTWKVGDKMNVVYDGGCAETSAVEADGDEAVFTAEIPAGKEALFLVYPSSVTSSLVSGNLTVEVPNVQDGTFAGAAIGVAPYTNPASVLKNLGGLLHLQVASDVDKIVIYGNGDAPLVGSATVTFTDGLPVVTVSGGTNSVTLEGLDGSGDYYAAVLPGSFDAGIYVELYTSGTLVGEKLGCSKLTVARRQIMNLGTIPSSIIENKVFVTVSGAGNKDGSSWDDAMDSAGFYSLVAAASNGKNVFMAAGVYETDVTDGYTVHKSTCNLSVFGGYPNNLTGTSLAGRDLNANQTVLSGATTNRILVFNNSAITATFDGLEFRNAYRAGTDSGSAIVINLAGTLKFNNCIVANNTNEGDDETKMGGGAVRVNNGNVLFNKCTFEGNTSKVCGGVFRMGTSTTTSIPSVTLDGCVVKNNSSEGMGGVIFMSKGTLTIRNGCVFHDNDAGISGGAIATKAQVEDCTIILSDSEFYQNRAASTTYCGGAVYLYGDSNAASLEAIDCSFYENLAHTTAIDIDKSQIDKSKTSTGGAFYLGQNSTACFDRCSFTHNLASRNGGAIRLNNASAKLYMNACKLNLNYSGHYASAIQNTGGKIALNNCSLYNNQNTDATNPATIWSTGECLIANSSLRINSSKAGLVLQTSNNSVLVNNYFVNSNSGKPAIQIKTGKAVMSYGHNLYSVLDTVDSADQWEATNAVSGSDMTIASSYFPSWVDAPYSFLKITSVPETYYKNGTVDLRATPDKVAEAIAYFDTQNSTSFKTWLTNLDEGSSRNAMQVDIRARLRHTDRIYPGCYEIGATQ